MKQLSEEYNLDIDNLFLPYLLPEIIERESQNFMYEGKPVELFREPFYFQLKDCEDVFVPVFSTPEALREFMTSRDTMNFIKAIGRSTNFSVKIVTDFGEFFDSIFEQGYRIMMNPVLVDENKTRWTEIRKPEKEFSSTERTSDTYLIDPGKKSNDQHMDSK
jgi:hypothetical protein